MTVTTAEQATRILFQAHAFAFDRTHPGRTPHGVAWTIAAGLEAVRAAWPGLDQGRYRATAADLDALWSDLVDVHLFLCDAQEREAGTQHAMVSVAAAILFAATESLGDHLRVPA